MFGSEERHNLFGEVKRASLIGRGRLHALYVIDNESALIGSSPDTTVDLSGFEVFQVYMFVRSMNASAPKYMYLR
jgi:hypothetical protein